MLKEVRERAGFTQAELAEKCGVNQSTIAMIENGTNKPRVPLAKKLAEVLNVDWTIFFE